MGREEGLTARPAAVLTVMCVGMFLVLLDVTVVNVALPSIGAGFGTGAAGLPWVVDGYAFAIAGLLLAGGTLGDRIGHRRVVMIGLALFGVASAACGLAPSLDALVVARAGQGAGAALLLPGSLAVITHAYPDRAAQARALGIWAGVSSLALPAGPLLGGLLVTAGGWRLVFDINIPVVAGALVAVPLLVAKAGRRSGRGPALPPLALVTRGTFVGPNLAALLMNFVINGALFVLTLYLQGVRHLSPLAAGLALLPLFVPIAVLAPVAGRLAGRFGPRPVLVAGASVAAAGAAGLALLGPSASHLAVLPAMLGLGVGGGLFTAPVVASAVRALPPAWSGLAAGVNNTARQCGTALGVAVFGAVAGAPAAAVQFGRRLGYLAVVGAALWLVALALSARVTEAPSAVAAVED
ncbi:MFS transporter [Pseudonocardia acaciae]|uniref:MFS transporter n=1 Tax=Pseudonocardia acaciae TaxID=551276 RepID=UPI0006862A3F|nr:MFS transporter [Pseudonocardia acaciae]